MMNETRLVMPTMDDNIITDLITAIFAARSDGAGVLTIAAVRARLEAAKLHVQRVEAANQLNRPPPFDDDDTSAKKRGECS
jgi:hypothetical protein